MFVWDMVSQGEATNTKLCNIIDMCFWDKEDVCIVFISEMSDEVPFGSSESFSVQL